MPTFLTVKEASSRTGKSASSIRRIIYPIVRDPGHADRPHIAPGVEEVAALRANGDNFAWRISEELLRRMVPADVAPEKGTADPTGNAVSSLQTELIGMLRRELEIKNEQIAQLNERLREGNILMGTLQQRLALGDGRESPPAAPVKPKSASAPEKGSSMSPKSRKKRRLFWPFASRR